VGEGGKWENRAIKKRVKRASFHRNPEQEPGLSVPTALQETKKGRWKGSEV